MSNLKPNPKPKIKAQSSNQIDLITQKPIQTNLKHQTSNIKPQRPNPQSQISDLISHTQIQNISDMNFKYPVANIRQISNLRPSYLDPS